MRCSSSGPRARHPRTPGHAASSVALLAVLVAASPARADEPVRLRWPQGVKRVGWPEAVAAPVLVGAGFTMLLAGTPPAVDFAAGTAFDRKLQDHLSVRSPGYQKRIHTLSQVGFFGVMALRAFDDVVVAGAIHGSWDVAWQLAVIDAEAFGLIGTVVWGSQLLVARQRPRAYYCETDPDYGGEVGGCESGGEVNRRSFISGHVAVGVAGASLTCLHHARFALYGGGAGDVAACGATAVLAFTTALARSTGDDHWPTDVLMGTGVGLVAGWLVPRLVHYGFDAWGLGHADASIDEDGAGSGGSEGGENTPEASGSAAHVRWTAVPDVGPTRAGLRVLGWF